MIKTIAIPARLQKENLTAEEQAELAAFGHQEMTADEVSARQAEEAESISKTARDTLVSMAQDALFKSDLVSIRCLKSGSAFPGEWQAYVADLRAIVAGGAGPLPDQPAYPAGT